MLVEVEDVHQDVDVRPDEVPTAANIGRQLKKIKVAMDLDGLDAIQNVEETSGQRFATAVDMAVKHVVHAQQGQQHMLAAIRLALAEACGPGGTITAAITGGITAACGPGGAISTMADRKNEAQDRRTLARLQNGRAHSTADVLSAIPNTDNVTPPFPETYGAFGAMQTGAANALLAFYGLPLNGTLPEKKRVIASFCNIPWH
ncbi:hypothetical protein HDU97_009042 [Phlyctochytrium planicorne]|nr:hypothetical protein HDU97_009042 [Phlyctochytrium planicorne]